jgi:hypothetical protein
MRRRSGGAISRLGRLGTLLNPLLQPLQHLPVILPDLVAVLPFPQSFLALLLTFPGRLVHLLIVVPGGFSFGFAWSGGLGGLGL